MSRLNSSIKDIHQHFAQYRLDMVSQDIYEFIWNEYCDWYVELAKASLNDDSVSDERKAQIRYVLLHVLETALRFTHPIMPYLTEQIWQTIAPLLGRKTLTASWSLTIHRLTTAKLVSRLRRIWRGYKSSSRASVISVVR